MTVGTDQHEPVLVNLARLLVTQDLNVERHIPRFRRAQKSFGIGCIAAETQQDEASAEEIECGATIREPNMGRARTRPRYLGIGCDLIGRRRRAVAVDDRRILITVAQMNADCEPFAAHLFGIPVTELLAGLPSGLAVSKYFGRRLAIAAGQHSFQIAAALADIADRDWLALDFVAAHKIGATPTPYHRVQLPAQVDGIADAGVHAEPTGRRHQMGGIARDKNPLVPLAA